MLLQDPAIARTRILPAVLAALWLAGVQLRADDDSPKSDSQSIVGVWQGTLKVGGLELRVLLRFAKDGEDQYKGSLDSPDQGAKGIPADTVSFHKGAIKAEIKRIKG